MTRRVDIISATDSERSYQDKKHPHQQPLGIGVWAALMLGYFTIALQVFAKRGHELAKHELRKIFAMGVKCLEESLPGESTREQIYAELDRQATQQRSLEPQRDFGIWLLMLGRDLNNLAKMAPFGDIPMRDSVQGLLLNLWLCFQQHGIPARDLNAPHAEQQTTRREIGEGQQTGRPQPVG